MPIYEYLCESCEQGHEALQKLSDPLLSECPACGEHALKKQVTASAFRLSGSGWYETDFKTGGKKKNLAGGGDSAKGSDTSKGTSKSPSSTAKAGGQ